ncbi:MAG TPA: winged helix-turn-helix domain-containing protein [Candidatus Thermoplasmatota archaeon]|nr:winged helix-turn-helix domain-containing protein [Candidatus Thermoplasmatota archaeon]
MAEQAAGSTKLVVEGLDKINLVTEKTRHAILEMLVDGAMTSRAISQRLAISQQLAYHHLQKLIGAGLVQVSGVDRRGNKEVYFYSAVAEEFCFRIPDIRAKAPRGVVPAKVEAMVPVSGIPSSN